MEDPRMRDMTHSHREDPELHKGRFLRQDEIIDPDKEEDDGRTDDSSDKAQG
jgi:hypothetical protein